jgi:hypothetical protein
MRNQYPGICYRCGKTVLARQGHFETTKKYSFKTQQHVRISRNKWRLQHAECAIKFRGTDVGNENFVKLIKK